MSSHRQLSKVASNVLIVLELCAPKVHQSASLYWASERLSINDVRWIVICERSSDVSHILIVDGECKRDGVELEIVLWSKALGLSGAQHLARCATKRAPITESVVRVVDVCAPVKWLEVLAT